MIVDTILIPGVSITTTKIADSNGDSKLPVPSQAAVTPENYNFRIGDRVIQFKPSHRYSSQNRGTVVEGANDKGLIEVRFDKPRAARTNSHFRPDELSLLCPDDEDHLFKEIFEVASLESNFGPLIMFLKDIEKSMLGTSFEVYEALKRSIQKLLENIVVIATHVRIDETATYGRLHDTGLFQNIVKIQIPQDEKVLLHWKEQLVDDTETMQIQSNIGSIRLVLEQMGIDCRDLDNMCIKDQALDKDSVEKIIASALSHHIRIFPHSSEEPELVITSESIRYGINILQSFQNEDKVFEKSLQDLPDNEFEKELLADIIPPSDIGVTLDDIGALESVKNTLKELVMLPIQRPELFSKGQLMKPCKGVLLFGPPGTGKTMLAKAIAAEAGANFINISMSSVSAKLFGDSEKYVKAVFNLASKLAPTVIFVDEVDSMLRSRNTTDEPEVMRRLKNEFMMNWDGLRTKDKERVLVLAASNRPFDLDDAVIRRLPRRLMVGLPDAQSREKFLKVILAKDELDPNVDLQAVANMTEGYSGSDIKNLCVTAAYGPLREFLEEEKKAKALAATDNRPLPSSVRPLCMGDFKSAQEQVCASVSSESEYMNELWEWNKKFVEGGSRRKEYYSYFI